MLCCVRGYTAVLNTLLTRTDLDVNYTGSRDLSPLMLACIEGHLDIVRALLERPDLHVNLQGKDGMTALGFACHRGHLGIVRLLVARQEVDINIRSNDGVCPFTVSVIKNNISISNALLARADLVIGSDEVFHGRGIDPLHVAASMGQSRLVRKMIEFGCDTDRKRHKCTIISIVIMKCQDVQETTEILKTLLEAGARPSLEHVTLAILSVPEVYEMLFREMVTPPTLLKICRKEVWKHIRRANGGRNIQTSLDYFEDKIPKTLLKYLRFKNF